MRFPFGTKCQHYNLQAFHDFLRGDCPQTYFPEAVLGLQPEYTKMQVQRLTDRREHQPSPRDAAPPTTSHLLVPAVGVLEGPFNTEDVEEIVSYPL